MQDGIGKNLVCLIQRVDYLFESRYSGLLLKGRLPPLFERLSRCADTGTEQKEENQKLKDDFMKKYDEDKNFKPKHIVLFGYSFGMTTLDTLKANVKNVEGIDIHLEIRY